MTVSKIFISINDNILGTSKSLLKKTSDLSGAVSKVSTQVTADFGEEVNISGNKKTFLKKILPIVKAVFCDFFGVKQNNEVCENFSEVKGNMPAQPSQKEITYTVDIAKKELIKLYSAKEQIIAKIKQIEDEMKTIEGAISYNPKAQKIEQEILLIKKNISSCKKCLKIKDLLMSISENSLQPETKIPELLEQLSVFEKLSKNKNEKLLISGIRDNYLLGRNDVAEDYIKRLLDSREYLLCTDFCKEIENLKCKKKLKQKELADIKKLRAPMLVDFRESYANLSSRKSNMQTRLSNAEARIKIEKEIIKSLQNK